MRYYQRNVRYYAVFGVQRVGCCTWSKADEYVESLASIRDSGVNAVDPCVRSSHSPAVHRSSTCVLAHGYPPTLPSILLRDALGFEACGALGLRDPWAVRATGPSTSRLVPRASVQVVFAAIGYGFVSSRRVLVLIYHVADI